jgi:hypothetical protein
VAESVTVDGWKLQLAFCGRLAQENCNVPAYPPTEISVSVSATEPPAETVTELALGEMVTVGGTAAPTGKIRVALLLPNSTELLV